MLWGAICWAVGAQLLAAGLLWSLHALSVISAPSSEVWARLILVEEAGWVVGLLREWSSSALERCSNASTWLILGGSHISAFLFGYACSWLLPSDYQLGLVELACAPLIGFGLAHLAPLRRSTATRYSSLRAERRRARRHEVPP